MIENFKRLDPVCNAMKPFVAYLFLLIMGTNSYGQDGSDIRYFKVSQVDNSFIGRYMQLDFHRRSFGGLNIDTVSINLDKRLVKFIEVRKDDGYNNWFSQQYLQSIDTIDGNILRISKFKLDSLSTSTFYLTMYLDYYDKNAICLAQKSRQVKYSFPINDIIEVLVKSKPFE